MALVKLELTEAQAKWLLAKLDKQIVDAHWARERPDAEDMRHCSDVNRELVSAAAHVGIRFTNRHVGRCDS